MELATVLVLIFGAFLLAWILWRPRKPSTGTAIEKIPGPPAKNWLAGHIKELSSRDANPFYRNLEDVYGSVVRLKGPLGVDCQWLYTYDPVAVYSIFVKNQACFDELEWFEKSANFFLGPGLLSVMGDQHKKQRRMLHPVFSAKHIRELLPTFYEVSHKLVAGISSKLQDGGTDVDVLNWLGRTALELIAQAGIGHSFDTLIEDASTHPFAAAVKNYVPLYFSTPGMIYHQIITVLGKLGMPSVSHWIVDHSPSRTIRDLRGVTRILHDTSSDIIRRKKAALENGEFGNGDGKDIMSVLLKANSAAESRDRLSDDELVAQVSTLLFAATDTTSNALARTLHVLSQRPEVQTKLREEILDARDGNDLPYDVLDTLPYLDAVCKEVLRVYSPSPVNYRQATQDTILPLSTPVKGTDGSSSEGVFVPKGSIVMVSLTACNCNKELWGDDADEWKPERWLSPLPRTLEEASIPGPFAHLMSFLGGPRACIGYKFAILEMKVVLSMLVANFTFESSTEKSVFWNHSGVLYPSTGQDSSNPAMWLKVGIYRGGDRQ
ncbi:cytochrome P450 [Cubamyces sp. BRFM 1775]|nr:cytochrome P450 [Cubamyces sp. BRFM 1775]